MGRRFPDYFYNWISAVGAFLATGTFCIIVMLIAIDLFVRETTLYLGLLTYMILPGFVVAGLVMIAVGAFLEKRRRDQGRGASMAPVLNLDLRNPKQRRAVFVFVGERRFFSWPHLSGPIRPIRSRNPRSFAELFATRSWNPNIPLTLDPPTRGWTAWRATSARGPIGL